VAKIVKEMEAKPQLSFHTSLEINYGMKLNRLATGWTVRGSNPGGGEIFQHLSRPTMRPTQPAVQWIAGLSWV
jgi:hypothetical protein